MNSFIYYVIQVNFELFDGIISFVNIKSNHWMFVVSTTNSKTIFVNNTLFLQNILAYKNVNKMFKLIFSLDVLCSVSTCMFCPNKFLLWIQQMLKLTLRRW